jgi:uncharacterized protein (UPF0335 family)
MSSLAARTQRGADGMTRHVVSIGAAAPAKGKRKKPDPITTNGEASAEQLRLLIERVERLEEEKDGIAGDIADVYAEAKATGFDTKAMKTIVALRKLEKHHRDEAEFLVTAYKDALGL